MCRFPAARAYFPVKYLGTPLTISRLRKVDFQYLLDKVRNRMAVLCSQPTHVLSVLNAPKSVLKDLDKIRKRFLLVRGENLTG